MPSRKDAESTGGVITIAAFVVKSISLAIAQSLLVAYLVVGSSQL